MGDAGAERWTAAQARAAFAAAPVVGLDGLCPGASVLVVAPHPDDESLGCGGLIARAAAAGRTLTVAALTDGDASHPNSQACPPARLAGLRRSELRAAADQLGGAAVRVEGFGAPDGRLGEREAEARVWLAGLGRPDAVFVTWAADPHPDHASAFAIAERQAAAWGAALFAYPIWGLTLADAEDAGPAYPCLRLDVSGVVDRKRGAIAAHRSQTTALIADDPHAFRLGEADLARHLGRWEVFMRVAG